MILRETLTWKLGREKERENLSGLDMIIHSFVHWLSQTLLSAYREWDAGYWDEHDILRSSQWMRWIHTFNVHLKCVHHQLGSIQHHRDAVLSRGAKCCGNLLWIKCESGSQILGITEGSAPFPSTFSQFNIKNRLFINLKVWFKKTDISFFEDMWFKSHCFSLWHFRKRRKG